MGCCRIFCRLCSCNRPLDIVAIQLEYPSLLLFGDCEVLGFRESRNDFRHSSDEHVPSELVHHDFVRSVSKRNQFLEALPHVRSGCLIAHGPKEFFEVERMKLEFLLFGRQGYVTDVCLDGKEGSRLDIVIASVFDESFDHLSGRGKELHFIEDHQGIALM